MDGYTWWIAPAISPYTRKMLAVLRFRRIPYRYIHYQHNVADGWPEPKVKVVPVLYFENEHGDLEAEIDSTPIIRRLEGEYPGRVIVPNNPVLGFLSYLLEDYGDEWLTKPMFHYRWYYEQDIEMAGSILPFDSGVVSVSDETITEAKKMFIDRQVPRLRVVGSNEVTAPVIEDSYKRFLSLLNDHLKERPFLLGERPCSADFACYGQLTQLAQFDPTPAKIAATQYPRVYSWVGKVEDLSGIEVDESPAQSEFIDPDELPATLQELLKEVGRTYVPVMIANAQALDQGLSLVRTEVDGESWEQEPFPYQGKCLQWLRIEYAKLDEEDRETVDNILAGTGCEALFARGDL